MTTKNRFIKDGPKITIFCKLGDFLHTIALVRLRRKKPQTKTIKRILLTNCGGLGDIVLSSGVIAEIKARYPDCKIGFLVIPKSQVALQTCPGVDWIHVVDSWCRPNTNPFQKLFDFFRFYLFRVPRIVKELTKNNYDCAIELRPFFPNTIPILWKARIPLRIGFTSSGNRLLLNEPIDWVKDQYLPLCYWDLLKKIGINKTASSSLMPKITLCSAPQIPSTPYLLFHICSFGKEKEMPLEFWKKLYKHCQNRGYLVYFTGQGSRETQMIEQIVEQAEHNLSNKLSWEQFIAYIQGCHGLVSVDSVPAHVAASIQKPCAVLFKNTEWPEIWNPNIPTTATFGINNEIKIEEVMSLIDNWMH